MLSPPTKTRPVLQMENLGLRNQLLVLRRTASKGPQRTASGSQSRACAAMGGPGWWLFSRRRRPLAQEAVPGAFWIWKIPHG